MPSMSTYLAQALINWILRGQAAPTLPANLYFAAYTTDPTMADTGSEVSTTSTGYARVSLARATGSWDSPSSSGATQNAVVITFPVPTGNWGQVTHIGIRDASSGGNLLLRGALTSPKNVNNGDPAPSFAVGEVDWVIS